MRVLVLFLLAVFGMLLPATAISAQVRDTDGEKGFWAQTALRGISFDGLNSETVRHAARQGYELSNGQMVDLSRWYSPRFPNLSTMFETQINSDFSLIWGASLGESGEKYRLGPSGTIGFALRRPMGKHATLNFEVVAQTGGALSEGLCIADYGAIGGVQPVNCRLAASTMSPKKTLEYRWDDPAMTVARVQLSYVLKF